MCIKKVSTLILAIAMCCFMSVSSFAKANAMEPLKSTTENGLYNGKIEISEEEIDGNQTRGWNPVFYSGKVYGYNSKTGTKTLVGKATWGGAVQPGYISVAKEDYWDLTSKGCDYWRFEYTWNSKDATYMKIHESQSVVHMESAVKPNTNYNLNFYVQGMTSEINLKMDWINEGISLNNIEIGGMKVIYN